MDMVNSHNSTVDQELTEQHRNVLGIRADALLEIIIFFAIALVIDWAAFGGDRFYDATPHPFWIIVLLLAVQYGELPALIAALVATAAYWIGNDATLFGDGIGPQFWLNPTYANPFWWIVAGTVVGWVRQRHIRKNQKLQARLEEAVERESMTANAYSEVRERKQRLEERVAGDMRSALTVHQAAKALETMSPAHLMRAVEKVVTDLLGARVFSLFLLENNELNASLTSGWESNDQFARSFSSSNALYQRVVGSRETLTVANADQAQILGSDGVLATPIVTATGEVLGMLKVESLPFARFGIHTVETARSIADWVAAALTNARQYETALGGAIVNPESQLMTRSYFDRYTQFVTALGKRAKFPVSLLAIGLNLPSDMPEGEQIRLSRSVNDAVKECLRSVDLAFDYQSSDSQYSIVLPTTNRHGAEIVRDKMTQSLEKKLKEQGIRYPLSTSIQELAA